MKSTDTALINSYSRLVNQNKKTIDDVPEEYKEAVLKKLETMETYIPPEEEINRELVSETHEPIGIR